MEIRMLTESDAAVYRALRLRGLREHPEAFGASYDDEVSITVEAVAQQFRDSWNGDDQFILGAFTDGRLMGMLGFRRHQSIKVRHKGFITRMYVAPETRGQGVGKALLLEAIRRARLMEGLEQVQLDVVTENIGAYRLFESLGFVTFGLQQRALKLPDRYLDEAHMVPHLA